MSIPRPKGPSGQVPIIGSTVIQVCPRGHIERCPAPGVGLITSTPDGQVFTPLCPVCQRDFFATSFPSRVLPGGSTLEDGKVEVLRWQEDIERQIAEANGQKPAEPS